MKKFIFAFALLVQTGFVFANDNAQKVTHTKTDDVKLYRQAATSTEVLKTLKSTEDVVVVRKLNSHWTLVNVNGEAGYVLTSSLVKSSKADKHVSLADSEQN